MMKPIHLFLAAIASMSSSSAQQTYYIHESCRKDDRRFERALGDARDMAQRALVRLRNPRVYDDYVFEKIFHGPKDLVSSSVEGKISMRTIREFIC